MLHGHLLAINAWNGEILFTIMQIIEMLENY